MASLAFVSAAALFFDLLFENCDSLLRVLVSTPSPPALVRLRRALAERLSSIADALDEEGSLDQKNLVKALDLESIAAKSESEYARNTIARFSELQVLALSLESTD